MKRRRFTARAVALLALVFATAALAGAFIEGSAAARDDQVIAVSLRVVNAFTPEIEKAIISGIPHTFTYFFEIFREVPAWPDMRIYHWQVHRTIKYDTLKKIYTVDPGDGNRPKQTEEFSLAKRWMTEFTDHPVAVTTSLDRNFRHYLRIKAELDPVRLPLLLDKLLFFVNLWSLETPWHRIDLPLEPAVENADE